MVVLQHYLVVKGSGKADHKKVSQLLVVAIFYFFLLTFQVAIYKFLAMHNSLSFILDIGGNSVEALKAVTGKPNLQLDEYMIFRKNPAITAKFVADAFDKFVPFYSLGLAFQT